MSDVAMTPVESSYIKAIGTDDDWLHIQFKKSGQTWKYKNAAHHHAPMLQCESPGKYFIAHIRDNKEHPGHRVGADWVMT